MFIGEIQLYAGDTVPDNFLECNGQAVSRTIYAALFNYIGTVYGTGDGSTTFNLPNFKGRTPVGLKSSDSDFDAIAKTGGAKTADFSHTHSYSHTHTFSGTTGASNSNAASDAGSFFPTASTGHTHTFSGTTGDASSTVTASALSSTQDVKNPYGTVKYVIRYNITVTNAPFFFLMN